MGKLARALLAYREDRVTQALLWAGLTCRRVSKLGGGSGCGRVCA